MPIRDDWRALRRATGVRTPVVMSSHEGLQVVTSRRIVEALRHLPMEVNRLVAETSLKLLPQVGDLPVSPIDGLEPMLDTDQVCAWTGYSRDQIRKLRYREADPFPALGTVGAPRFLPSDVIAWMREEYARTRAAA
jgi:predicted DNA-binding transcriptional regulator AlpA